MENKKISEEISVATVPFNMYDGLRYEYEDRLEKQRLEFYEQIEKEKADKQKAIKGWKQACITVAIALIVFLGGIFGTAWYFMTNYELVGYSYSQDGSGFNNMNNGEQGDVDYGAEADSSQN